MTDNMDSSQPEGNNGTPIPPASEGGVQHSSEAVSIPKEQWVQLQKTIERLERETQSDKDRAVKRTNERIDKFEKEYIPVLDRVVALMGEGISKEQALNIVNAEEDEREFRGTVKEVAQLLKGGKLPTGTQSGNGVQSGGVVSEVIKQYGLDENDPEVMEIYKRHSDPKDARIAAQELVISRSRGTPSISAAPAMQGTPISVRISQQEVESLAAKRNSLYREPSKNREEIRRIEKQLVDAGVPID